MLKKVNDFQVYRNSIHFVTRSPVPSMKSISKPLLLFSKLIFNQNEKCDKNGTHLIMTYDISVN